MKTLYAFSAAAIAALVLTFGTASTTHAQGSGMYLENWKDILLGPMFEAGASVNAGPVDDGTKTSSRFAFAGGAMLTYPFSEGIALDLTVCYDQRGVNYHSESDENTFTNYTYSYLSIRPEFKISGFMIGAGIGVPMGASTDVSSNLASGLGITKPATSDMNLLIEGRIGADITAVKEDKYQIHILLGGSYPFNTILKKDYFGAGVDDKKNNGPLATGQIGVCYMFDLNPH